MAFDRSSVKGLPEGAQVQVIKEVPYVYFRYSWKDESGKIKYARDYLGIVENGVFVPNDYYLRVRPTKSKRPSERWSATTRKETAIKAVSTTKEAAETPLEELELQTKSIGVTALAMSIIRATGMFDDVKAVLGDDTKNIANILNLAIAAAITAKPTYLSADESRVQMFIGGQECLTSPRASELHKRIGANLDLSARISQQRISHLSHQPLLALDGSRLDCNSSNILEAAVGRRKDDTFGSQINFSLLVDATTGSPVGYRYYSGVTNDISTLEDFVNIWNVYGLLAKDPMLVVDQGYYSQEALIKLGLQGYRFLAGAKTGFKIVKSIIDEYNSEFYEASSLLKHNDLYGHQSKTQLIGQAGKIDVSVNVFRNPVEEMNETRRFMDALARFEAAWLAGKADPQDKLLEFYKNPKPNKLLEREEFLVDIECYSLGYFAFVTNTNLPLEDSLEVYKLRNEAEVVFKLMMGNLLRSTRAHSTQALDGLLFTTFIALGILTNLRLRMRPDFRGTRLGSQFSIAELIASLKKIQVVTIQGKSYLINVTSKDKAIAEVLGFPGLFDSAESAMKPLMDPL